MKRIRITRSKFYAIRKAIKLGITPKEVCERIDVVPSTITKILKAHNFKEYKEMGMVYGVGVKVLRKRYLFILAIMVVVLVVINLLIK